MTKLTAFPDTYRGISREEWLENNFEPIPPKGVAVPPILASKVKKMRDRLKSGYLYDDSKTETLERVYVEIYEQLHPYGPAAKEARRDTDKAAAYKRSSSQDFAGSRSESEEVLTPEVVEAQAKLEGTRGERTDLVIASLAQLHGARAGEVADTHDSAMRLYVAASTDIKQVAAAAVKGAYDLAAHVIKEKSGDAANADRMLAFSGQALSSLNALVTEQRATIDRERQENARLRGEVAKMRQEITSFIIGGPNSITEAHRRLLEQTATQETPGTTAIKEVSNILGPIAERFADAYLGAKKTANE